MTTFCELYITASPERLSRFLDEIKSCATGDWSWQVKDEPMKHWIEFDYDGERVDHAAVFIITGDRLEEGQLKVNNIVPLDKNQLTTGEYNDVLRLFYKEVVEPYKKKHTDISITQPTGDVFDPTTVISKKALEKLELFCNAANKSTGASHPCDQERWFEFICQTVDDDRIFDADTLGKFLQDEAYWGERKESSLGSMGRFAWDEEHAWELALEYERACDILKYYKETRG